jgi:spermidine synthase
MILRPINLADTRIAALFLVSLTGLAFEIEVMRVFAVASWSNFGSMVIGIALLGFGLAGTLLAVRGDRVARNPDAWLSSSAFALAPSMAVAHACAQQIPFNPVLIATDPSQLWWIGMYYVLYGLPFFAAGVFVGAMFATFPSRTHLVYFWNMSGSGAGGILVLAFMFVFPPGFLIYPLVGIALLPALLCCVRWNQAASKFTFRAVEPALCLLMAGASFALLARFGSVRVSDFKPESYARRFPDSTVVYDSFSPRGQQRVYASSFFHFAPGLSDNASISLPALPSNAFLGMYVDGNGPVGILRKLKASEERYIDFLPMAAPYKLLQQPSVLILRLGGGAGVHTALYNKAREVWVVEPNPDLVRMMRDVPYFKTFTGNIMADPRVHLVNGEVRAYTGSTSRRFDLVEIGLIDSIGLSQAGGYSVEENYTYTVEAIQDYLACLAPGGILSITVWDRLSPPRNVPRLLSTVVEALRQAGVPNASRRVFAFNLLLSTATVLVKNGEFTARETDLLSGYCRQMSFDVDHAPGMAGASASFERILQGYEDLYRGGNEASDDTGVALKPSELYRNSLAWLFAGRQEDLYQRYVFDIRPATDDKPYYAGYLKPSKIIQFAAKAASIPEEWGYLLLLATFLQSLLFGAVVILIPLATRWRELSLGRGRSLRVLVYFACLGLGYMMAEICLIQKFVFYLADPVYANTIVITVLLISSGIGSVVSGRFKGDSRLVVGLACVGIVGMMGFLLFGSAPILRATLGYPLLLKVLIAIGCITPLGLLLGVPFPMGLATLSKVRRSAIPWAWGVNGALSVSGTELTRILSTSMGFSTVLAVTAGLYLAAALMFAANSARYAISSSSRT